VTSRARTQIVVTIALLIFCAGIVLVRGNPIDVIIRLYSVVVLTALAVFWIWERFGWKWKAAQRFSQVPRDISGTWLGELNSFWIDPSTGSTRAPKTAVLVVRQTASSVGVALMTDESLSRSSLAKVSLGADGVHLDYMYLNEPKSKFRSNSPIHHGSSSMAISGGPANMLSGHYWTDRDTRGELTFNLRSLSQADTYEGALSLFAEAD